MEFTKFAYDLGGEVPELKTTTIYDLDGNEVIVVIEQNTRKDGDYGIWCFGGVEIDTGTMHRRVAFVKGFLG
jgi:hypothetical protein